MGQMGDLKVKKVELHYADGHSENIDLATTKSLHEKQSKQCGQEDSDLIFCNEKRTSYFFFSEITELSDEVKPVQILRYGEWEHPYYGSMKFDSKYFKRIVKNFEDNTRGVDIPFNFDHKGGAAPGWVTALKHIGNKLYAVPEWTALGRDAINNHTYKYISVEISDNYIDLETGKEYGPTLVGIALTNYPFVKGMEKIGLSETFAQSDSESLSNLEESKKEVFNMGEVLKPEVVVEAKLQAESIKQQLSELSSKLAGEEAKRIAAEMLLDEQTKRTDLMDKKLREKERDEIIGKALSDGKLTPAIRDNWASEYALKDPEGFQKFILAMPKIVNLTETGKSEEAKGLSATEMYNTEIKAVMDSNKLSYKDAMIFVNKGKPDLYKSYKEEN